MDAYKWMEEFGNSEVIIAGDGYTKAIEIGAYPDATPMVKTPFAYERVDTLVLRPKTITAFMAGLWLVDAIRARYGNNDIMNLVLPNVPGARQDRINPSGDFLFTLRSVAKTINNYDFQRVAVFDPHSILTESHIDRCCRYPLTMPPLKGIAGPYAGVIAPDAGAIRRGQVWGLTFGVDTIQAKKHRDVTTGALDSFEVTVTAGQHYLVVDDLCDGGGTFLGLGAKIIEQGATADLYVSHGLYTKGTEALLKMYGKLYTTDSTVGAKPGVEVIPIMQRMIEWTRSC